MPRLPILLTVLFPAVIFPAALVTADEKPVDYLQDIKPILKDSCYACHGALKQESGLRLDTAAFAREGGDSGPVAVAGKSDQSLLIDAVTGDPEVWRMPPEGEGEALNAEQIALLRRWIDQGADGPEDEEPEPDPESHWAFQPLSRPEVPAVENSAWVSNPIDAFIAREHEQHGLSPVPPAEKHLLLRRVFLDLIGLPPTREELEAFLSDESPDAYERLVDRLLGRPEYGERWGRHWMDVWRYSDWYGRRTRNELRNSQRHIWRWRDWIVESLNEDKGYDRMILEMLAADELAADDPETLRATGYLARSYHRNRNRWIEDTVEYTSMSFLGLTFGCARCHDHKYDPISQEDYYRFRAIFEPHDLRIDRVPGQPDPMEDGLPRAYDARLNVNTFLFEGGDPQNRDRSKEMLPGVPESLNGAPLEVEPVELPPQGYYPELNPVFQDEERASHRRLVNRAKRRLRDLKAEEPADDDSADNDSAEVAAAEKQLEAAEAALAAIEARIAADNARFDDSPPKRRKKLASAALEAEKKAALCQAEADLLEAERQLADAQQEQDGVDAKQQKEQKKAAADAKKQVAQARKTLKEAQKTADDPDGDYTPVGEIHPATSTGRRLALARWMTRPDNPLTARVAVNHIWMRHLGRPLVESVADFGRNGREPTHPDLLDWLAVEFMNPTAHNPQSEPSPPHSNRWSLKHLHRLIVTSNAYRMQSAGRPGDEGNQSIDPDNNFLWRMNTRRMEAEVVRDSLLHVAGGLDRTMGGPDLEPEDGETIGRRSIYFRHAGDGQMTFLEVFDVASPNECFQRTERVVPHQALALANSALGFEQSRLLAQRLTSEVGDSSPEFEAALIELAFVTLFGRSATDEEVQACSEFLSKQADLYRDSPESADAQTDIHQRACESLIHVLINHHDFVTIH